MLEDEGYKLMGAGFEVYNELGYGMAEEIYQQSLEIELLFRGFLFRQRPNSMSSTKIVH
jgi:GxxExxY protein